MKTWDKISGWDRQPKIRRVDAATPRKGEIKGKLLPQPFSRDTILLYYCMIANACMLNIVMCACYDRSK